MAHGVVRDSALRLVRNVAYRPVRNVAYRLVSGAITPLTKR